MQSRRQFVTLGGAALAALVLAPLRTVRAAPVYEVTHTDAEWRKLLTANQYAILRQGGTERPNSSPLNQEHRAGRFSCAGCNLPLFSSSRKFESGTGWPSFWEPLPKAVVANTDVSLGMVRSEIDCRRCGGHLGHVFDDGPQPTGMRYCMNGAAMTFAPGAA